MSTEKEEEVGGVGNVCDWFSLLSSFNKTILLIFWQRFESLNNKFLQNELSIQYLIGYVVGFW